MKIIIAGRTSSGKTTLAAKLAELTGKKVLMTSTNRPRRYPGEDTYHFYTAEEAAAIPEEQKMFLTRALDGYERWTSREDLLAADIAILDGEGIVPAIDAYHATGHRVLLVYVAALQADRCHAFLREMQRHGAGGSPLDTFCQRDATENDAFNDIEGRIASVTTAVRMGVYGTDATCFGEDSCLVVGNDYTETRMDRMVKSVLDAAMAPGMSDMGGVCVDDEPDDVELKPADMTRDEWVRVCRLLKKEPDVTTSITLHLCAVETVIDPDADNRYAGEPELPVSPPENGADE